LPEAELSGISRPVGGCGMREHEVQMGFVEINLFGVSARASFANVDIAPISLMRSLLG
jgi:hypothetical protein